MRAAGNCRPYSEAHMNRWTFIKRAINYDRTWRGKGAARMDHRTWLSWVLKG